MHFCQNKKYTPSSINIQFVWYLYGIIYNDKSQSGKMSHFDTYRIFLRFIIKLSEPLKTRIWNMQETESRKIQSPFKRKRHLKQFGSLIQVPFSEDKRQKLPPPQRSVMNGLCILLSLHISWRRGRVKGHAQMPLRVCFFDRKEGFCFLFQKGKGTSAAPLRFFPNNWKL